MQLNLLILRGSLVAGAALLFQCSIAIPQVITFTNPAPAGGAYFGHSVAAAGTNQVLIGAYADDTGADDAGAAYLFSTDGTLLTTFTNPAPAASDYFGSFVASLGADRALIAALGDGDAGVRAGAVYLFCTNGTLLTTFTNPTPADADSFGSSVAAVGDDLVLIGAPLDDTGTNDAGVGYLFDTNGVMLTTITNPTPADYDWFGRSVAALSPDQILVGAPFDDMGAEDSGVAYLFRANGTLITTFTNPTSAVCDHFGFSMAALGTDRVLIGALGDTTGAPDSGAVYLFNTNGALLMTFTNPAPEFADTFGNSLAAVGTDLVVVGVRLDNAGADDAGTAYLFSTNGTLLMTFTNPTPAVGDTFGVSLAAVGSDRVLIGADGDDAVGTNAGVAYLFSLALFTADTPSLALVFDHQLASFTVFWPASAESWVLERSNTLASSGVASWPQVPPPYQTNAGNVSVTFTNTSTTASQFFRLHKP